MKYTMKRSDTVILLALLAIALIATIAALPSVKTRQNSAAYRNNQKAAALPQKEATTASAAGPITDNGSMSKTDASNLIDAKAGKGLYITYENYQKDPAIFSLYKTVYFFYDAKDTASQNVLHSLQTATADIPPKVVFVGVNMAISSIATNYGVSHSSTFVQTDHAGKVVKTWSTTNLSYAIATVQ